MIESNSIETQFWGHTSYLEADLLQKKAWEQVRRGHPGFILGGSVDLVVTQGLRGQSQAILNPSLQSVRTNRGGETTLHSPGQLLIYPILNLRVLGWGVKKYIENLLLCSSVSLKNFDVPAELRWDPLGVWTAKGKLGFCGVQVKSGVTQHGLALNIRNDLSHFDQIVSCGLIKAKYDKAEVYQQSPVELEKFFQSWCSEFRSQYFH